MNCFETQDYFMNTIVEQKIYSENPIEVYKKTIDEIKRLEKLMSFFIVDSDISRLNKSAGKEELILSSEVIYVLSEAYRYSDLSKGAFDITLAPLIDLWRRNGRLSQLPREYEIKELLKYVGYEKIKITKNTNTAFLEQEGAAVDLGGIGKGFAADICVNMYKSMGVKTASVNFGGNVKTVGKKLNGDEWVIGIQDPWKSRGVYFGAILVSDLSVVTSGEYERYFEVDGNKYHHLLDYRTGWPSESDVESVTVICESSLQADALSTAAFVMGLNAGVELICKADGAEAIFVTKKRRIYLTKGITQKFYLTDKDTGYSCFVV